MKAGGKHTRTLCAPLCEIERGLFYATYASHTFESDILELPPMGCLGQCRFRRQQERRVALCPEPCATPRPCPASPLHWLGEHLFTAHMIDHEIIMACAAPLLAFAHPIGAFLWAFPAPLRRRLGRAGRQRNVRAAWTAITSPLPATIWHGAAIWFWHAPIRFDAAVGSILVHRLQHLTFLVSALAFWWALMHRADRGSAVFHLFATMIHTTPLGALIGPMPSPVP